MHAPSEGANSTANTLTEDIEAVQAKINTARVQADHSMQPLRVQCLLRRI